MTIFVLATIGAIALCVTAFLIFRRIFSANDRAEKSSDAVVTTTATASNTNVEVSESLVAAIVYAYHNMKTSNGVSDEIAAAIALSFHSLKTAQ
jgi:hypothetical protein